MWKDSQEATVQMTDAQTTVIAVEYTEIDTRDIQEIKLRETGNRLVMRRQL